MKLDLRKSKAATSVAEAPAAADDELVLDDPQVPWQERLGLDLTRTQWVNLVIRVIFLMAGIVGLKIYEVKNIKRLNFERSILSKEVSELKDQKQKLEKKIEGFGALSRQSKQFNTKLDIIQSIMNDRIWAIKGLDQIRSSIPEKVWLNKIKYRQKKFVIDGASTSNKEIERFVESLENTQLFSQVHLNQMTEREQVARSGVNRRFFTVQSILK